MWLKTHIFCCILFLGVFSSYAQETKEDIEKQAENYFEEEAFLKATPLFLRLLSLEPRNPNYNYKYGTCLLYNSSEKKKAFRYLNFAVSKSNEVDNEAYYYLGKAYHLTYQFNKAIENYERYKSLAGSNAINKLQVDRQIQMCKNGKALMANISETIVLNKQEIDIESFFRIYDLNNIGGELIVTEEFQSRQDKKNNHTPLIHFPANSDRIYYSSYTNSNDHKDIVMRTRLPDGSWSLEQPVFGEVNTNFDEDYPYMHPTGKYLYFSSKGHNSMGGYDVFRSPYDRETNTFGKPENLDIAISSPDNDFLYIVDSLDKYAYFASQRESEMDKVNVYHVRVERFPIQIVILKGKFSSTLNPNTTDLSIVVNDASGKEMGRFNTDDKGGYIINLPKGGKYEFVLNVDGKEATYKQWIELPFLKEFRPLKQKIIETEQDGSEIVMIQNLFDEEFDDPIAVMAEVLEQKSKMEVNKENFDLDSLDRIREQRKLLATVGLEKFSNNEIKDLINSKYEDLNKRLNTSKEKIAKAKQTIQNSSAIIEESLRKSDSLMSLANTTSNEEDKERFIRLANQEIQKVKFTEEKVKNAVVLLEFLENDLAETEDLFEKSKRLKEDLDNIDSSDDKALLDVLSKHKPFIEKELLKRTLLDAQFEFLTQIEEQLKTLEEQEIRKKQLEQQKIQAQKDLERLKEEVANAKRREKEALEMEMASKENQISDINNELDYTEKLIKQGEKLKAQKEIAETINNTSLNENQQFKSTTELKNQLAEQSTKIKTQSQENEKAIADNNIDISNTSDSTNESNNTNEVNEVTESERQEILDEIDNNYTEEISQIEKDYENGEASIDEVIKRKSEHRSALESALEQVENDITENGENPENTKRKQVLESEILSTENEVAELEQIKAASADTNETAEISESERQEIINEVDNNYAEEIEQIENDYENGEASIDEVINRKSEYRSALENALDQVENDIAENGETPENTKRKQVLESEILSTENEVAELEQIKAASADTNETAEVTESERQEILDEVDNNYTEEISQIENDYENGEASIDEVINRKSEHRSALENALDQVENDIAENGETPENTKRKQVLESEILSTENEVAELEQIKAASADTNETAEISESERQEILDEIDNNYAEEIAQIENDYENGEATIDEVINRKSEHRSALENALEQVKNDITENGENPENTKRKQVLETEILSTESQVAELEQIKAASADTNETAEISESERQEILDEIDNNYAEEIEQIENDYENGEASIDEVINRKSEHRYALENALDQVENDIAENGETPENTKRKQVLESEILSIENEVAELEQIKAASTDTNETSEISESERQEILNEVDNNYAEEIAQIKKDYLNGNTTVDEVIERKSEYLNTLENSLEEVENDITENGETPKNTKRKQILEDEIQSTESEITKLEQIKETATETNVITEVTESEKQQILKEVDNNYAEEITKLENEYNNGEASIDDVIERELEHRSALEIALEQVKDDIAENGETSENTKRKQVLEEEILTTNNQIAELEKIKATSTDANEVTEVTESERQEILKDVDKSYQVDVGDLSEEFIRNKVDKDELIKRKQQYIDNIDKALNKIEKDLSNEENVEENKKRKKILTSEKRRVSIEINELEQSKDITEETIEANKKAAIAEAQLSQEEEEALETTNRDIESLQLKEQALSKVEKNLNDLLDESTTSLVEKRNINSTLENVNKEKRQVQIEIGELSQEQKESLVSENNEKINQNLDEKQQSEIKKSEEKIEEYTSEKEQLEKSIANSDSPKEAEKSQKKLNKIEKKIAQEETKILEETTDTGNDVAQEEVNKLQQAEETSLTAIEAEKELIESKELIQRAENTKDPVKKAALLKEAQEKQNNAIAKSEEEQAKRKAVILIGDITSSKELNTINPDNVSETTSDIEEEQIQIGIRLLEIDDQLNKIDALLPSLSKNESEELKKQKDELLDIQKKLKKKQKENADLLDQIENEKVASANKGIDENAIENELSYKDEVEIAQTNEYKEISRAVNNLEQKQYELKVKQEKLLEQKNNLKNQLETIESKENPSQQEKDEIAETLTEIDNTNHEIEILENEIREQQENVNVRLPDDSEKREQIENMIARNVDPVVEAPTLPTMSTGIVLLDDNQKTYSDENPIPLTAEKPEGLVFRVQIGAFSKPVPNETFNDFSPVTGEEVRPGLIRYMAGYFGSRGDATEARNQIRTMGYSDAFVVAYCDGERIPVYRAEQLLASGACVPSITTSGKPILTAEEATDQNTGGTTFEKELDEFAYNKAPGAAEAEVAESKMGLYYTVQVGVYNKPVSAEQLKNISPLITKRLPNGQMRYSSGVFDNLEDAREKRSEAVERGISDAFIVAYYKGERITVSQAKQLVEENGENIFESKTPTIVKRNKVENKSVAETPAPAPQKYFEDKAVQVQFVSKTTFGSYPTQVIQRYNSSDLVFYYDDAAGQIKSILYNRANKPELNELSGDFSEKYFYNGYEVEDLEATNQEEAFNENDTINELTATVLTKDLNNDLIQVILNSPLLKQIETTDRGLKAIFYEVNGEEKINTLQVKLARFGATQLKKSVVEIKQKK